MRDFPAKKARAPTKNKITNAEPNKRKGSKRGELKGPVPMISTESIQSPKLIKLIKEEPIDLFLASVRAKAAIEVNNRERPRSIQAIGRKSDHADMKSKLNKRSITREKKRRKYELAFMIFIKEKTEANLLMKREPRRSPS